MIKLILSTHFRSGGTALWDVFRKSNPNVLHYYEPFYPNMGSLFKKEKINSYNRAHKIYGLRDDYFGLSSAIREKIASNKEVVLDDVNKAIQVLSLLHNNSKDSIIKICRCLWFLSDFQNEFNCKVVHLLRNPLDQILSIGGGYYTNQWFEFLIKKGYIKNKDAKDNKSLFVWVFINKLAWEQISKIGSNGIVVRYEDLANGDFEEIEKFSGFSLKTKNSYVKKSVKKYNKKQYSDFLKKVEKLDLIKDIDLFYSWDRLRNEI